VLEREAQQEAQLHRLVLRAVAAGVPAAHAGFDRRRLHHLLAAHRRSGLLQHLLQAAVADVVDLIQVVQVAHQHHAAVGAGQAGVAEAVAQLLEGGVVLEYFRRVQAAGTVHEQRDHEGVDLDFGVVVVAQVQGRRLFLDVCLQGAAAFRIGIARHFDGAVQHLVMLAAQRAPDQHLQLLFELGLAGSGLQVVRIGLGDVERQVDQVLGQRLVVGLRRLFRGFAGSWALSFWHVGES
jgi:hypothetical protein